MPSEDFSLQLEQRRLLWQCRRGMLELDMLLQPFVRQHYAQLSTTQQQQFMALLEYPDQTLQAWFFQEQLPEDKDLIAMIAKIKQCLV